MFFSFIPGKVQTSLQVLYRSGKNEKRRNSHALFQNPWPFSERNKPSWPDVIGSECSVPFLKFASLSFQQQKIPKGLPCWGSNAFQFVWVRSGRPFTCRCHYHFHPAYYRPNVPRSLCRTILVSGERREKEPIYRSTNPTWTSSWNLARIFFSKPNDYICLVTYFPKCTWRNMLFLVRWRRGVASTSSSWPSRIHTPYRQYHCYMHPRD